MYCSEIMASHCLVHGIHILRGFSMLTCLQSLLLKYLDNPQLHPEETRCLSEVGGVTERVGSKISRPVDFWRGILLFLVLPQILLNKCQRSCRFWRVVGLLSLQAALLTFGNISVFGFIVQGDLKVWVWTRTLRGTTRMPLGMSWWG